MVISVIRTRLSQPSYLFALSAWSFVFTISCQIAMGVLRKTAYSCPFSEVIILVHWSFYEGGGGGGEGGGGLLFCSLFAIF